MRKTLIAFVVTAQANGKRTYTAFTRDGIRKGSVTVNDCGHGAHLAHEFVAQANCLESLAEWALALHRKHGIK